MEENDKNFNIIEDNGTENITIRDPNLVDPDVPNKLLEPDHPLLERFQQLLKQHLLKQIDRIKSDVDELETGIKKKNNEREQIGVEAYETQQLVNKQQKTIDNYVQDLVTLTASREEIENQLHESNNNYKKVKNALTDLEKKETELRNEIESTDMMINQLSKWEEAIESDVMINRRIVDKSRKDKIQAVTEKKKQDMLLYKLTNEVWKLEKELETMTTQLKIKEDEREKYAESLFLANIDIETNENENKCLLQGWQSLIVTISSRDKYYNSLMETEREMSGTLESLESEIIQIRKLVNKEHIKHETSSIFKSRIEADIKSAEKSLRAEMEKKAALEKSLAKFDALNEQLEKDKTRVQEEINAATAHLRDVDKEYEKVNEEKNKMEEEILEILQEESSSSHDALSLSKKLKDKREANRSMKIVISKRENTNSNLLSEIQTTEFEISETERIINELKNQEEAENAMLSKCVEEYEECEREISKKEKSCEMLKKKLEKYERENSSFNVTPQEIEINTLESQITEAQEKNKELQKSWLREQSIVVDLVEKRQNQVKNINLLKKQITILEQKNLKISDELEYYKNQEASMKRNITNLQTKLTGLTESLYKRKDDKDELDVSNALELSSLSSNLEESELESLKLKEEIGEIEEDKILLSKELVEKNREALCWEKKIKMALEAKKNIEKERGEEGEIGKMKSEIHRMNVRCSQLKKVQEKLMQDLEHCITRRDSIVTLAEAKVQSIKDGTQKVRLGFNKKIDEMQCKLNQMNTDQVNVEKSISTKKEDIEKIDQLIGAAEEDVRKLETELKDIKQALEERHIDKQFNLDMLIFKQRKVKVYVELARGRIPYTMYKTESALNVAYDREKDLNSKLRIIIENLLTDFPAHRFLLTKIHNSLVLSIMKI